MLTSALRWNSSHGAFNKFQQCLLYTFTGHITRDRWVVRLAGNLVNFINVNNAALRFLYVVVTFLQQFLNDIFDVLTHITGLGQRGGIGHGKWHIQETRQGFSQQRFAATGRPDQQDVTLA
ncbi:hypothetical protein SRABI106_03474 [Rahnella aquatilis]|nr:hypothetical protein SRABI106_03474 [Rahnella aquatilis]